MMYFVQNFSKTSNIYWFYDMAIFVGLLNAKVAANPESTLRFVQG